MPVVILLLSLACVLSAAESAAVPVALPAPVEPWCAVPAWLDEPLTGLPVPVIVDAPYQPEAGELPDPLQVGDRLVGIAEPRETLLRIARQSLERDGVELEIERAGLRQRVTVDRVHLERHLRVMNWTAGGAKALAALGISGDAASLDRIPGRVLAHLVAGGKAPWVATAVATWLAVEAGAEVPPAGVPAADPFIARCEALWRTAADGDPLPDPWAWGVDPDFAALYLPYPAVPGPALGNFACTDQAFLKMVQDAVGQSPDASLPARRQQAYRQVDEGHGTTRYLGQVKAAILDGDHHGGWPFRSRLIWEKPERLLVIEELRGMHARGGADQPLVALALIGPLVMENAGDELVTVVEQLRTVSPLLAWRAFVLAGRAAGRHPGGTQAFARLQDIDRDRPFLIRPKRMAFYRLLLDRLDLEGRSMFADYDPVHGHPASLRADPAAVGLALSRWWDVEVEQGQERKVLVERLNHVAWWLAVDPRCIDAESARELADQLRHLQGRRLHGFVLDTVAACAARGGDFPTAIRFQELAIANIRGDDHGFMARLALFRTQVPFAETEEFKLLPQRREREQWPDGTLKREGRRQIAGNQRFGWWRTFDEKGRLQEEQAWREDQPLGLVRRFHPNGGVQELGAYADGIKVGRWRTFDAAGRLLREEWWRGNKRDERTRWSTVWHPDGKPAEAGPWLNNRQDGFWQAWRTNGTPASAGRYVQGEPSGNWRTWDGAGKPVDRMLGGAADTF